ncbi:hypothetical protein [Salinibacter ruber]|uniref:hypothetical protein n=1 Tax=Salinibacter ruber TaxID=146919 RepID=UPI0020739E13|nr:hypothetical protein [Salinibacter ruber]
MATSAERFRKLRIARMAVEKCPISQAHIDQYGSDSTYASAYDAMKSSLDTYEDNPTDANADTLASDVDSWTSAKGYDWSNRTQPYS